jgi:hypothetical protein
VQCCAAMCVVLQSKQTITGMHENKLATDEIYTCFATQFLMPGVPEQTTGDPATKVAIHVTSPNEAESSPSCTVTRLRLKYFTYHTLLPQNTSTAHAHHDRLRASWPATSKTNDASRSDVDLTASTTKTIIPDPFVWSWRRDRHRHHRIQRLVGEGGFLGRA